MDVVFHAADKARWATELFGDTEIRVQRVVCGFVAQERAAVLGGENQMNVNSGRDWGVREECQIESGSPARIGNGARLYPRDQSQQINNRSVTEYSDALANFDALGLGFAA